MVTVYEKDGCQPCKATKRKLEEKGIPFETKQLSDPENRQAASDLGHLQAPVVVTPAGDHWSGYRPDLIAALAS